ncbi:MAG: DNA recombination protein RmuC [Candidatus Pacebacteria bacterium]|nr:DNA recombination protein RmuC [Candidatus Paceibacterota bacterium]
MLETIIIILLIALFGGFLGLIFYLKKQIASVGRKTDGQNQDFVLNVLKNDLKEIKEEIKETREKNSLSMESQLKESAKIVREVTEKLTKLDETNKQVVGFAEQLQSLENILKNPKQRGILGEYSLETLLKSGFTPKNYKMQYEFKDGQIVDAVLFIGEKIIPIDSKFSLENYNKIVTEKDQARKEQLEKAFKQDLKNRIDETAKYIRPEEGTFDFALMFIPAEGIYYDLMVNEIGAIKANTRDLLEYAVWEKNVHIVSPNSFYAYLQTILQGLRAFTIEDSAKEIKKNVEILGKHLGAFDSYMQKLGGNLGATINCYNTAYKELGKIDKDVVKITEGERQIEPLAIDKPSVLD